jgi:N6-adenosine-specific RNA methylase IME4
MLKIDSELKSLIPALSKEEFEQLEKNILDEGIRDPIVVWGDTIIDGHNRYEIACKHRILYNTVEKIFDNKEAVTKWMIINQFGRRNLTAYDRSILALKLKPVFEEKAKERMISGKKLDPSQKSEQGKTSKEIAKVAGLSHDTIAKVEKIEKKAPEEIKNKVKSGEISINQAYQQVKKAEKIEAIKEKITETNTEESNYIDIYTTDKKYSIIYADPAWKYWDGGQKNQSLHYNTMTLDDICKLPVKNITDDSCILFLWVTFPILQECFKVIDSWGFKYSTCGFNWIKKNKSGAGNFFGCGSWTRANSELCLIATKGNITRLDASISQVIEYPIEEHSKKPDITRDLIVKLVGELPRIELFSRKNIKGWDCWGDMIANS